MTFLKKYVVWIILALILVGEGGATFALLGRKGKVAQREEELAGKEKRVVELRPWKTHEKDLKDKFGKVRANLGSQRDNGVLFFWRRDRALEAFFADDELADFRAKFTPWTARVGGLERSAFQDAYNKRAEEVVKRAEKLWIDRGGLGLASDTAFTPSTVTVGDIYASQKEFRLIETIVDAALAAEVAELDPLKIGRGGALGTRGRPVMPGTEQEKQGTLFTPITADVVVRCPYPMLPRFVEELHKADVPCRVEAIIEIARGKSKKNLSASARMRDRPTPRMPGFDRGVPPEGFMEGPMMEPPPPVYEPRPLGPEEMMERGGRPAMRPGEVPVAPVPGAPTTPGSTAAAPEERLVEGHLLIQVTDFNLDIAKASFTGDRVNSKGKLATWLDAWVKAKQSNNRVLWQALRTGLDTAQQVNENGETLAVTFRPDEHFEGATYPVTLEMRDGTKIALEFRLVIFTPAESEEGVAKATPGR